MSISTTALRWRGAPSVRAVQHIHPSDALLNPAHGDGKRRPSDHAAVAATIALSTQPTAPARWNFRRRHLLDDDTMASLRLCITRAIAGGGTACARLERVRSDGTAPQWF